MRPLGKGLMIVGGLLVLYFWLFYDASVSSSGGRVMNIGLMNDRMIGTIVGIGAFLAGTMMIVTSKPTPQFAVPPPVGPKDFTWPVAFAVRYPLGAGNPTTSLVLWRRTLEDHLRAVSRPYMYSDRQIQWGHTNSVSPERFPDFVDYIEAYRVFCSVSSSSWLRNLFS